MVVRNRNVANNAMLCDGGAFKIAALRGRL